MLLHLDSNVDDRALSESRDCSELLLYHYRGLYAKSFALFL